MKEGEQDLDTGVDSLRELCEWLSGHRELARVDNRGLTGIWSFSEALE